MPSQTNATVTAVTGSGTADDWDRAGEDPPAKWAGEVRAYYRETTDRQAGPDGPNVLERRELILDTADVDAMDELDTDDLITFTPDDGDELVGTAQAIARRRLKGIPTRLQTTKITLEVS